MAEYKLIKVRSKCQIKGCRSTGLKVPTFSVSASKEGGVSVVACEKCIEGMFEKLCQMRGLATYAELIAMQNADDIVQSDTEKELLERMKLITEENEQLKKENAALKTAQADENNAKTPMVTDGAYVVEEPTKATDEENIDVQKSKKTPGKKTTKESE